MSINSPGDASMATDRVGILSGTSFLSSATIRSKTGTQSMNVFCRKIRRGAETGTSRNRDAARIKN